MSKKSITIEGFEVRPVRENDGECEVVQDPAKADFWTLYARLSDGTAEALKDFPDGLAARDAMAYYGRCENCVHLAGDAGAWLCQAAAGAAVERVRDCPEGLLPIVPDRPEPSGRLVAVASDTEDRYRVDVVAPDALTTGAYEDFAQILKERQSTWRIGAKDGDLIVFWTPTCAQEGKPQWASIPIDADEASKILAFAAYAKREGLRHVALPVEVGVCDKGDIVDGAFVEALENGFRFAGSFLSGGTWEGRPFSLAALYEAIRPNAMCHGIVGDRCPVCGSDDVEGESVETGALHAFQEIGCLECGASWVNRYDYFCAVEVER